MADKPADLETSDEPIRATIDGTELTLLPGGAARLRSILDLIRGAGSSLRLLFYIFNPDEAGTAVRDALAEAAGRGVAVKLLLDGFGCGNADSSFFQPIADRGGEFCMFHPSYGRRYFVRNHQKLVVADDRRAIIGGANIHADYLSDDGPLHWRDLWLLVEGQAVPAAAAYFDSVFRWTTTKGSKLRQLRRIIHCHSQSQGPLQWKFTSPLSRRNPWPSSIARDVAQADRVDIIAAYFTPPGSMLRRLARRARARGGAVRIITAAKSDNLATIAAARHDYARMLRAGVEMYEYQAARLHSKLAILDDVVHIGSANFDFRSFYINLEIVLRIEDAGFARLVRGYFDEELARSEPITPELHRRRGTLWRRVQWTISHWLVTSMDYTVTRRLNFGPER